MLDVNVAQQIVYSRSEKHCEFESRSGQSNPTFFLVVILWSE